MSILLPAIKVKPFWYRFIPFLLSGMIAGLLFFQKDYAFINQTLSGNSAQFIWPVVGFVWAYTNCYSIPVFSGKMVGTLFQFAGVWVIVCLLGAEFFELGGLPVMMLIGAGLTVLLHHYTGSVKKRITSLGMVESLIIGSAVILGAYYSGVWLYANWANTHPIIYSDGFCGVGIGRDPSLPVDFQQGLAIFAWIIVTGATLSIRSSQKSIYEKIDMIGAASNNP